MGLLDGLKNLAFSPLRLVTQAVAGGGGGALTADGATAQVALASASTPLRSPLHAEGSLFGAGGSPQAQSGAQAAMMSYPTNGAGTW